MEEDYSKPIIESDRIPTLRTVEFTEDEWNTVYEGHCIESSIHSYKVRGLGYGTFWIPKIYVRLKK